MSFISWMINTSICIAVGFALGYVTVCGMDRIRKTGKLFGKVKAK